MDEDFEMEERNPEMPIEGMDLEGLAAVNPALAPFLSRYFGAMDAESASLRQQATNKQKQFEAARAEIEKKRYGAPTTSEQLFALGAAFLSPRRYRGFAGTLDKITPVLGQMEQAQRSASEQRAEALEKLRREYLMGQDESAVAAARAQREALGKVLPSVASATKPRVGRIVGTETIDGIPHQGEQDPVTGVVRWTPINPDAQGAALPQLTAPQRNALSQLREYISNPNVPEAQRQSALRNFQTKFKVDPLNYLKGAM